MKLEYDLLAGNADIGQVMLIIGRQYLSGRAGFNIVLIGDASFCISRR